MKRFYIFNHSQEHYRTLEELQTLDEKVYKSNHLARIIKWAQEAKIDDRYYGSVFVYWCIEE